MSATTSQRVDVIIDLAHPAISWEPLHHGLEALDDAGFVPHRLHQLSDYHIARVDYALGGALGAQVYGGAAWFIEEKPASAPRYVCGEKNEPPKSGAAVVLPTQAHLIADHAGMLALPSPAGVAGYLGAVADAPRLAKYRTERDLGVAGPFALNDELRAHRPAIVRGVLFGMRELGLRRALLPAIDAGFVAELEAEFAGAILERKSLTEPRPPRAVVCASGNGSNFQAVIDAVQNGRLGFDLRRLVTNREGAYARERARQGGIPETCVVWRRGEQTREQFDRRIIEAVAEAEPDLVLLLGWMHVLPAEFVHAFPELLNIHPAYLPLDADLDYVVLPDQSKQPAFRGARAVDEALEAGARWIGATVHRVIDEVDRGAVLARGPIPREAGEDEARLRARLHDAEHTLLLAALHAWAEGRV